MFPAWRLSCQRVTGLLTRGPFYTPLRPPSFKSLRGKSGAKKKFGITFPGGGGGGVDIAGDSLANWFALTLAHWAVGKDEHVASPTC